MKVKRSVLDEKMREVAICGPINSQIYRKLRAEFGDACATYRDRELLLTDQGPPTSNCEHAIIRGFSVSDEPGFSPGELKPFFHLDSEDVFIWTHAKRQSSVLVSCVSNAVHCEKVWRSAGILLLLANGLSRRFEILDTRFDYDWIYNFAPSSSMESLEFYGEFQVEGISSVVMSRSEYSSLARLIELLIRDDRLFVATQNVFASVHNHVFCFHCAFEPESHRSHPNHELPIWQIASAIPRFEAAIVQATRAVEAILGKPGKRDSPSKLQKIKERWREVLSIDPDSEYKPKRTSYLDFYYELFSIRNDAAHSLGQLPVSLTRSLTIDAQAFAYTLLEHYFDQHSLEIFAAKKALAFYD
jgi:hypothetical protein